MWERYRSRVKKMKKLGSEEAYKRVLAAKANITMLPAFLSMVTVTVSLIVALISSGRDIGAIVWILTLFFVCGIYVLACEIEKGIVTIDLYDVKEPFFQGDTASIITRYDYAEENFREGKYVYNLIFCVVVAIIFFILLLMCFGLHVSNVFEGIMNLFLATIWDLLLRMHLFISSASDNSIVVVILFVMLFIMHKWKKEIIKLIDSYGR